LGRDLGITETQYQSYLDQIQYVQFLSLDFILLSRDHIQVIDERLKGRGIVVGVDTFKFTEIGSRGPHRFDLLLNMPGLFDRSFIIFLFEYWIDCCLSSLVEINLLSVQAPWVPLIEHVLGDVHALHISVSVVYSRPGMSLLLRVLTGRSA
jgi:hypothetical protein